MHDGEADARDLIARMGQPPIASDNIPPGHQLRGLSSLMDGKGNVVSRWVKTERKRPEPMELLEEMRKAVAEWPERFEPPPYQAPDQTDAELMAVYPLGDPHIGMLSWARETGANFDLEIAERNLVNATRMLASMAPMAKRGVIIQLGDFFHADDNKARTPQSGHVLDVDGRHAKVLRVGIRTMIGVIDAALTRHEIVDVYCLRGNHDPNSAIALQLMVEQAYRDEPRVVVCDSPAYYKCLEFGANMIGMTHGDGAKPQDVPGVFACDFPEIWGRTTYRHVYSGHVHHESVKEYRGIVLETVRTLAAGDAWHSTMGYRAGRSMFVDVWHHDRGPVMRHRVGIEAIEALP